MYKKILASLAGLMLGSLVMGGYYTTTQQTFGASTFVVQQGGTGKATLGSGQVLYGNGIGPIGSVATGTITCTGSASCGAGSYVLGNSLVINSTGGSGVGQWFTPVPLFGATVANATSTLTGFTAGIYALASSTIGDGTSIGGLTVTGSATTTLNQTVGGQVIGKNGTAASPAFTFSGFPNYGIYFNSATGMRISHASADVLGILTNTVSLVSSATLGWSSAGVAAPDTNLSRISAGVVGFGTGAVGSLAGSILALATSTIGNGTQAGGLTISGGATTTGNLLVQGNATSTAFFATIASTTNLFASSGLITRATTTDATTTTLFATTASSTNIFTSAGLCNGGSALQTDAAGKLVCGSVSSSGLVGNWFTPVPLFGSTVANATSTLTGFTAGLYALASSTIGNGTQTNGLTIAGGATTTLVSRFLNNIIISNSTAYTAPLANTTLLMIGTDANPLRMSMDTYNNATNFGSQIQARRARGTAATPLPVAPLDTLFSLAVDAYGNTGYHAASVAAISFQANGTSSDTSAPTNISFLTTPTSSVTMLERMRLGANGELMVGSTSPLAKFTLFANNGDLFFNNMLAFIASSTAIATSTFFSLDNTGSTTIGGGTSLRGLTINGGATTTGNLVIRGNATTTAFFATIASTTNLTWSTGNGTSTSLFSTVASSTKLFARFANFNFATTTFATTTSEFAGTASTTNLFASFASFGTTTGQLWPGTAFTFGSTTAWGKTQFGGTIASSTSNCSGAIVVNFATGNSQKIIATGACSISFATSTMVDGFAYKLKICQDPTGNRAVTFGNPGQMVFSGGNGATTTPNLVANSSTWMGMIYDGTTQRLDVVASSTKLNAADPRSCQP